VDTPTRADAVLAQIENAYRERYTVFLRVAIAIVGDVELARDAVHDAFVRAVRHRKRYRGGADIEPWLWRIVVNASRKRRRGGAEVAATDVEVAAPVTPLNGDLRAIVAALPERQRQALFLRYYADLDYQSIAEALGVKPGTVAASLHGAHQTLRRRLEETDH
jgi:RNA polymerase sigma-70 factor (ECF subfamily)